MTRDDTQLPVILGGGASAPNECDAWLIDSIMRRCSDLARPIAVGLCGPQGSGKSTMAAQLAHNLTVSGRPAVVMSLDDFYLTHAQRLELARDVHPLLLTRGVPGTHDLDLAIDKLSILLNLPSGAEASLPLFDKTRDDRVTEREWRRVRGPVDVIILEGWCVGARPQPSEDLTEPVNALERNEDRDGRWRRYANQHLAGPYHELFARLDLRIFLRATFEFVQEWRAEQEAGLRRSDKDSLAAMDSQALHRFIAHYERLTRWMEEDQPADLVIDLNAARIPIDLHAGKL